MYCDKGARIWLWAVSRPRPRHGQPGAWHNVCDKAARPATRSGGPGHDMAKSAQDTATRARPMRAGWAVGAHCALGQFLDLILFLSHCLGTVHKIFRKKNEINFFEK